MASIPDALWDMCKLFIHFFLAANTFKETFPSLADTNPEVLYPSLDFSAFDGEIEPAGDLVPSNAKTLFLSINRYERKKNLGLAIEALGELI